MENSSILGMKNLKKTLNQDHGHDDVETGARFLGVELCFDTCVAVACDTEVDCKRDT